MTKPATPPYHRVLSRLDVDARDALYIGDWGAELEGASAVGMTPLLLDIGERDAQEWEAVRLCSLVELLDVVDGVDRTGAGRG